VATYQPEFERYGAASMQCCEELFYYDSEAFIDFLNHPQPYGGDQSRWLYAMASTDRLLNDFKFSIEGKKDLLYRLNKSFGNEFAKNKHLAQQLSERYRKYRSMITGLLDNEIEPWDKKSLPGILEKRTKASQEDVKAILDLYETDKMDVLIEDLLSSLIHMSMNRIFRNNNRLHEMVLYDFLFRYYKSTLILAGQQQSEL
jgi:thiopeptide-type bacteriocin biosynthesis protein